MKAVVLSVGASTPLGLDARQTALLVRAKKLVVSRAPLRDRNGTSVGTVRARRLPDDLFGRQRMIALAAPALREALRGQDVAEPIALALAAPKRREGAAPLGPDFASALGDAAGLAIDPKRSTVLPVGHAGFAVALERAIQLLDRPVRGEGPRVVVGGVDTYYDPDVLAELDAARRLHGPTTYDGCLPSEGAAFAVLAPPGTSGARAGVRDVAVGAEAPPTDEEPSIGLVATRLVRRIAAGFDGRVPWVMLDVNNEHERVQEWSFVSIRNHGAIEPGATIETRPSDELGDLGAATGAVYLVLASVAFELGFAPAREVLISLRSEGLERGVFAMEAP